MFKDEELLKDYNKKYFFFMLKRELKTTKQKIFITIDHINIPAYLLKGDFCFLNFINYLRIKTNLQLSIL